MTSAVTRRSRKVLWRRTASSASVINLRLYYKEVDVALGACFPTSMGAEEDHLRVGAAAATRRPASAIRVSSTTDMNGIVVAVTDHAAEEPRATGLSC